jgi:RES domain
LNAIFELEGATNDRLLGEAGLLPGISVRELVFGISYSHIVNAVFTHANPLGNRFNGPERGAWYAAFFRETSEQEVYLTKNKENSCGHFL